MSENINIERSGNSVLVNNFQNLPLSPSEIAEKEKRFVAELRECSGAEFDMANLSQDNYQGIIFFLSCGEICRRAGKPLKISNLFDERLQATLAKLGYDKNGEYRSPERREPKPSSIFISAGDAALKMIRDIGKIINFTGEVFLDFLYLLRHPGKIDRKELVFYMDKGGADAIPIVTMICFLVGLILAFQGLAQLRKFGLQVYIADLVGLSIIRELGPLMVAMICIGRAGSAFAAELGTMKVSEELDAIKTMGLSPARFLVLPKIAALTIVMPMLVVIGDFSGIIGGIFITSLMTDITISAFYQRLIASLIPQNILESIVKGFIFAFIIAAVGCFRGMEADNDAKGVGVATTSSVVSGVFLVVIADALVTMIFPQVMRVFGVDY